MTAVLLWLALFGVLYYALAPLLGFGFRPNSRVPLPRHAGHARPAQPRRGPEAGPAHTVPPVGPAGTPAAVRQAGDAAGVPLGLPGILNPRLYETGEMPGISQAAADEAWWGL